MPTTRLLSTVLALLGVTIAVAVPVSARMQGPGSDSPVAEWRSVRESLAADRVLEWPDGHHVGGLGFDYRNDRLLVTDRTEHTVRVYGADGAFVKTIGSRGAAPGQFEAPGDVAAVPGVGMAVSDTGNDRIQILDDDGAFVRSWPVDDPHGLLVEQVGMVDVDIWVVSPSSRAVYRYGVSGALEQALPVGDTTAPGSPEPVGLAQRGTWVADRGIGEVRLATTDLDHTATLFELPGVEAAAPLLGTGGFGLAGAPQIGLVPATGYRSPGRSIRFERVKDLEGGPDGRAFAAVEPEGVVVLDDPAAAVARLLDNRGQLVQPRRVAVGATLLLADALPRVQIWSRSGAPLRSIDLDVAPATERSFPPADVAASGSRQYALLGAYSMDSEFPGRIYAVEDDSLVSRWPVFAVAISAHGDDLAALDAQHQTVSIYHEPTGLGPSWALDKTGFRSVMDIALSSSRLFLANHETGEVEQWSRDGALLASWPVPGGAIRVATDAAGRAYVLTAWGR